MSRIILLLVMASPALAAPPSPFPKPPPMPPVQEEASDAPRRDAGQLPPIDFDLSALKPAVAVPVAAFQSGGYFAGHRCPNCSAVVLVKSGSAGRGQHWHVCPYDGTAWWHRD